MTGVYSSCIVQVVDVPVQAPIVVNGVPDHTGAPGMVAPVAGADASDTAAGPTAFTVKLYWVALASEFSVFVVVAPSVMVAASVGIVHPGVGLVLQ